MMDDFARNLLRPDNYELFDIVRDRLNARPAEPVASIANDIGVTVDQLCRWVCSFSEKKRPKSPYQGKSFAALAAPRHAGVGMWSDNEARRKDRISQKARDGARATRLANEAGL